MPLRRHLLLALCSCILLGSCATNQPVAERSIPVPAAVVQPTAEPPVMEEQPDLSCAYFYFLWGSHAEFQERYPEALEAYEKALLCDQEAGYIREKIPLLLLKTGELEKAADWLAQAIERQPDNNTYLLLLAGLYLQREKVEEAVLLYNQVLEKDPENDDVRLRLALLYSHLKKNQLAEEIFRKLLKNDVDSYFTHLSYARLLKQMEKYHDAAGEYEKALSLNWSKELAFEIGYFYLEQKMVTEALRIFTTITDNDPFDEQAALSRIQALLDLQHNDEALEELSNLRLSSENQADIDLIIAKVLLRKNEVDEAKKILTRLVRETNGSEPRYMLALLAYQEEDYDTSLEQLAHIESGSDEFEEAVYLQTRIYQKLGNVDAAIKLLKKHTTAKADLNPLFYALLSSLHQAKGEYREAMALLETAINIFPDNHQLLFEYGLVLEKIGNSQQAIAIMEKVLELQPDHAEALNYIGYTWADNNVHLEKALEYILRANTLKPDNGFILDSLGWVYYRLGDFQQAVEELEHAVELIEDDPHIYDHLGDVYRSLGKFSEAREALQKAYEMFTDETKKAVIQQKIDALENR